MKKSFATPLVAAALAIAITTAMDATGYTNFSALPLIVLFFGFWILQRNGRKEIGFALGRPGPYLLPFLHPIVVLAPLAAAAYFSGEVSVQEVDWEKAGRNLAALTFATMIMALITEEGFFRGWMWASFRASGRSALAALLLTSLIFMLWHIPFATLSTEYKLPADQTPIYLVNAFLLGLIWGLMRLLSGSILVSSVAHGIWNGVVYTFFAIGDEPGLLAIENTRLFGPETGIAAIALNLAFAAWLLGRARRNGLFPPSA